MTTTEHLNLIRAKCVELLAIAEKRTPGEWSVVDISPSRHDVLKPSGGKIASIMRGFDGCHEYREAAKPDARFIAACAGAAEAGWRSTIAAIDGLLKVYDFNKPMEVLNPSVVMVASYTEADATLKEIIAAWPLEILKGGEE